MDKTGEGKTASAVQKLAPMQVRFVEEYMLDLNATQAAVRAGYSAKTAREQGSRLLSNVIVQSVIAERMKAREKRTEVTADRILKEAARLALFDVRKLFNADGTPKPITELDDDTAAGISGLEVATKGNAEMGVGEILKYKIADKNSALEKCMRHLGMFEKDNKQAGEATASALSELLAQIGTRSALPVAKG